MTLPEIKSGKGEKETMTVSEFINAVAGQQLTQYDKLFDAAVGKTEELPLALQVLNAKADRLQEWLKLAASDSE